MTDATVPQPLLRAVARDLRPVRPLPPPWVRAVRFAPVGLLLFLGLPVLWGFRSNLAALGSELAWGVSGLQVIVGLAIVGLGLRESVPGRELRRTALLATAAGTALLLASATLLTAAIAPAVEPAQVRWRYLWECFYMAVVPGALVVAAAVVLVARARPVRPAVAGALCGLGPALIGDAGARLFCWVSSPLHVLVSHGGAIVALTLLGAAAAAAYESSR